MANILRSSTPTPPNMSAYTKVGSSKSLIAYINPLNNILLMGTRNLDGVYGNLTVSLTQGTQIPSATIGFGMGIGAQYPDESPVSVGVVQNGETYTIALWTLVVTVFPLAYKLIDSLTITIPTVSASSQQVSVSDYIAVTASTNSATVRASSAASSAISNSFIVAVIGSGYRKQVTVTWDAFDKGVSFSGLTPDSQYTAYLVNATNNNTLDSQVFNTLSAATSQAPSSSTPASTSPSTTSSSATNKAPIIIALGVLILVGAVAAIKNK